ncbi:uncharacterized protein LOC129221311 [Uloborus diversus]|uniref:uncharacterized protein LOC129221311 n=1 Tax=Uloborus diversus TaxID=327109 RepID=UPI00240A1E15|nr:uncharacterized protein LOC129221311 [Uloborus diversus]
MGTFAGKVPTVYDVLQLVYQVCSTDEMHRHESLSCVSEHMGKEVEVIVDRCFLDSSRTIPPDQEVNPPVIKEFCEQMTHVPEWVAKHASPPPQLTRVMGLAALGRMACVLGEVQRPLPMWQAAFAKCFRDYQSTATLNKSSTKNRSENALQQNEK